MKYANPEALADTNWLADNLGKSGVVVIDATWFPKQSKFNAADVHEKAHIPGAIRFDVDDVADRSVDLPHMLPDATLFAAKVGALGIGNDDKVITYDASGGFMAAARAWWMFRVFGHENVAMLNGCLPKWLKENRPTESGAAASPAPKVFAVERTDFGLVRSVEQVLANIEARADQVVDARNAARFAGTMPEPWPVDKIGHIPGSLNLPFDELMDKDNANVMRPADEIAAAVRASGLDTDAPIVTSCGSGVTAAVLNLGLYLIGHTNGAVYDGSWSEWGKHPDTPVER
ncbi:MAG: sulfurtransferase [Rhodospirillales bacterium]|jgi:thiosulfate/3-mercaptopyruvate sulfurtransferase|nr:sulfurtransferase [Rhodospirillales bacterium]